MAYSKDYSVGHLKSQPEVFCEKYVLENLAKFKGKNL